MEMTIQDFEKLLRLQHEYLIYLNGEEVLLDYNDADDEDGSVFDNNEWNRWSFIFKGEYQPLTEYCSDYLNGEWAVVNPIPIDWRNL